MPPSPRRYDPHPPRWEYPSGAWVLKLDCQGLLDIQEGKWKVSKALSGEIVQVARVDSACWCSTHNAESHSVPCASAHAM